MYKPVYAPFAVTYHGEWVEPETAAQEDYDILFCEFCRLKISVVIDELTGVNSFVHTPLRLETAKLLATCPYSKPVSKFAVGKKTEYGPLQPAKSRQLPYKTTKQNWLCIRYPIRLLKQHRISTEISVSNFHHPTVACQRLLTGSFTSIYNELT
ncbi:hypothetical protein ABC356_000478 [Salmonella enterica]|nr:hypothetical protein [Salmonella enterica]EDQ7381670.1 hypothetical protein [Salmonella enterica subsp. diarizonae serovar 35:l,v:z35]EAA9598579.1 hypothetical protein [Salmonella enterica]EAO9641321.1 hypothetical protein [Salmonella enterica]EAX5860700.1 hypothetical protein [Salmonella enterica]